MPEPSTVEPADLPPLPPDMILLVPPRLHDETAGRCAAITGLATGGLATNPPVLDQGGCIAPPLRDLGERPIDLDLSHAATPSGPFAELVADKRVTLTAQAALGRLLQGDEDRAADLMRELPAADRGRVAEAATMLAIGCSVLDDATELATPPAVRNAPGAGDPDAGTGTPDTAEAATAGRDHTHECACNRNWGGPCGPCVCEQPPNANTPEGAHQ